MGEMADFSIDQGEDELARHNDGDCEDSCPYCADDEGNVPGLDDKEGGE